MLFSEDYFLPLRSSYMFRYDNPCKELMFNLEDFYWAYFEHLFDYYEEVLLNDSYILTVAHMRDKAQIYISQLASDYYDGVMDSVKEDMDSNFEATCSYETYQELLANARTVLANLTKISEALIYQMFHHLYGFILSAKKYGIAFESLNFKLGRKDTSIVVSCVIDTECIKRHDQQWYDRASMLTDV